MLIDVNDYPNYTKYPIAPDAKGYIGNILFPYKRIKSITLQVPTYLIYHIKSIYLKLTTILFLFSNSSITLRFTCLICSNSLISMILNKVGTLAGNMYYDKLLYNDVLNLLHQIGTSILRDIPLTSLRLHTNCIIPFCYSSYQSFNINNVLFTKDIKLQFVNNVQCKLLQGIPTINLFGDCPLLLSTLYAAKISNIIMRNSDNSFILLPCAAKHLVIKHSALSDIRVITEPLGIILLGLKHAIL